MPTKHSCPHLTLDVINSTSIIKLDFPYINFFGEIPNVNRVDIRKSNKQDLYYVFYYDTQMKDQSLIHWCKVKDKQCVANIVTHIMSGK